MDAIGYRRRLHMPGVWLGLTSACLSAALIVGSIDLHNEIFEPAPTKERLVASHPAQPLHVEGLDVVLRHLCLGCLQRSRYQGADLAAQRAMPCPLRLSADLPSVTASPRSGAALVPASRGPPTA